ncbi:MAG: 3-mercaptopyruvate sulfurtransferase [Thiolinea sp.]
MAVSTQSGQVFASLVEVDWLAENINEPDIVVLDSSWHMPQENRDGETEWYEQRIPGSRFFDFDGRISDQSNDLPHMLPDVETFNREVRRLGVNQNSRIVVYDVSGVFSGVRAWWMFRVMGHHNVAVLNGGLPAWKRAGQRIESGDTDLPPAGNFSGTLQPQWVHNTAQVQAALQDPAKTVIDARSGERYSGVVDEPRPGLKRGHMPGALNLPFVDLHDTKGCLQPPAELKEAFTDLGLEQMNQPLVFSCGSGVTACVLALGAELAGYTNLSVYDGSWTEWGQLDNDLPVVTGWDD